MAKLENNYEWKKSKKIVFAGDLADAWKAIYVLDKRIDRLIRDLKRGRYTIIALGDETIPTYPEDEEDDVEQIEI